MDLHKSRNHSSLDKTNNCLWLSAIAKTLGSGCHYLITIYHSVSIDFVKFPFYSHFCHYITIAIRMLGILNGKKVEKEK